MKHNHFVQVQKSAFLTFLTALMLFGPGCGGARPDNPLVKLRQSLNSEAEYSVILADMKQDRGLFSSSYTHMYQIVIGEDIQTTPWQPVPQEVYRRYESYLGMTLLSKTEEGSISEAPHPPGYQYVGNTRYGRWERDGSGNSFWSFYGKYAMMSHLFGLGTRTVYRGDWNNYRDYSRRGRAYYGPNKEYGTNGSYTKQTRPNFYRRTMNRRSLSNEKFGNKVQRRVGRSRTSYRSRGGGYGK